MPVCGNHNPIGDFLLADADHRTGLLKYLALCFECGKGRPSGHAEIRTEILLAMSRAKQNCAEYHEAVRNHRVFSEGTGFFAKGPSPRYSEFKSASHFS